MPPKTTKEVLRKELTTCQNPQCGKSRLEEGVTLSKCAGCKIALYCSKDCQKAGWPAHKTTCKINQRSQAEAASYVPGSGDAFKSLRAFCSKHRPSLAEYGIRSLDLSVDYTRSLREVVLLTVKSIPNPTRPEKAFVATDANVVPLAIFGPQREAELRSQLQDFANQQKKIGKLGGIMVVVVDIETNLSNICPVGFDKDVLTLPPGKPWRELLINTLNNGIVY